MTTPVLTNPITVVTIRVPGSQGPGGIPGPGNTLSIGTVSTTPAGTNATANVTGTSPSQILNLTVPKGDTGPANVLSIGTVTTGSPGTNAAASIGGTAPSQTLNLTIPKGEQGATGPANTLAIGTVTTGTSGSLAAATIAGTAPNQTLNLTIPKGTDGIDGVPGPANTLTIGTVTTGTSGSNASATVTGTAPNQTLNLVIPRGNTGADGAPTALAIGTVTTGAVGSNAAATVTGNAPNYTLNLTLPRGTQGPTGNDGPIGQSYGGGFAAPTANGNLPLTLNIVSNWGVTDAGVAYYTNAGAPSSEAGLMMPNIDTGSFSVWRPGAPYQTAGSTTATNNSLLRRTSTGTAVAATATVGTELSTLAQQTSAIAAAGVSTETPNTVVRRDASGDIYVTDAYASAAPTAVNQLTRKDYVDGLGRASITSRTVTASGTVLNASDAQRLVVCNFTGAGSLVVPNDTTLNLPVGTWIDVINFNVAAASITTQSGVSVVWNGPYTTWAPQLVESPGAWLRIQKTAANQWTVVAGQQDTGWIVTPATSPWLGNVVWRVKNGFNYFNYINVPSSSTPAGSVIMTFPAGARPLYGCAFTSIYADVPKEINVGARDDAAPQPGQLRLNKAGSSGGVAVSASFPVSW